MNSLPNIKVEHSKVLRVKPNWPLLKRKEECQNHSLKLKYECQHSECPRPYFCPDNECLESHFHNDVLCIRRFSQEKFREKLRQAEISLQNTEQYQNQTNKMRAILDGYKNSLVDLFTSLDEMRTESDKLIEEDTSKILNSEFLNKIEKINQIDTKINSDINDLRGKFTGNCEPLFLSPHVTSFLKKEIEQFEWETSRMIWSNFKPQEKLPEMIQNKSRLLFLFIGDKMTIGSYFPTSYLSLSEKTKKAPGSFIFVLEDNVSGAFIKFKANDSAENHIQMTEKLLISQGNRPSSGEGVQTFGRNLDRIFYYLPTQSYERVEDPKGELQPLSGQMRLRQLLVFQIK